ncbi:MAG: hypothetical protein BJ554DRAFT_5254 [Olpidium bornovanus]|uniref:alpha,alpha-trehalase n=1 Tax=Olpidium bornovanus TaxID=278681 RepID=A0A8H7ZKW8_9FUNG|nr:MAG: hypothetical protein BJ554DRAFT_5254 [Olpidium bornovanus]
MFEKYDARKVGVPGDGGEYVVQEGFGWSNGVVLWILDEFALRLNLTAPESCQNEGLLDGDPTDANVFGPLRLAATRPLAAAVGGAAFFAGVGAAWFGYRRMRKRVSGPERHEMA